MQPSTSVRSLGISPKCLNRLCLTLFLSLQSSLLLVHLFLPNFFLPVIFAFDVLWYSTLSRATPFSNDFLWLTLFVEGVNKCILDHCQVGGLPHYCGFKEQAAHIMAIRTYFTRWLIHTTSFVQIHKMCTNDLHITLPLNLPVTGV